MGTRSSKIFTNTYMILLIIITFLIAILVHVAMFFNFDQNTNKILDNILSNDAEISDLSIDSLPLLQDVPDDSGLENITYPIRYFYAVYDKWGKLLDVNINHAPDLTYPLAESMLPQSVANLSYSEYVGMYKYKAYEGNTQTVLVYLDRSINLYSIASSFAVSMFISVFVGVSIVLFLIINGRFSVRSNITINADSLTLDENNSFPITVYNASHELSKAELRRQNESEFVISQEERMNLLVKRLLMLSNLKREDWLKPFSEFSLSDTVLDTILSFQTLEEVKQKHIELNVERGIFYSGNQTYIRELITILMDNAIKYSEQYGTIIISLNVLDDEIELSIKNTCSEIPTGDLSRLFQSFYRASCENSRNGCNFGIGLAIAKAIVKAHSGTIYVYDEDDMIDFTVSFKSNTTG